VTDDTIQTTTEPEGFSQHQQNEIARMADLMRRAVYSIASGRDQTVAMGLTAMGNAMGRLAIELATSPEEVTNYAQILKAIIDANLAAATGAVTPEGMQIINTVREHIPLDDAITEH
jgi:hypothetical protein